jgi:glycosyltransferase involved in cell wall biosynthesis
MNRKDQAWTYALITPAYNEEEHIERLIDAVTAQTLRPVKYIIVSDGSTDRTEEIVKWHARELSFLELLRRERNKNATFGSKALAFNAGWERLRKLEFNFVGNIDADISFEPDYFESLIGEFEQDKKLGLAGGLVHYPASNGRFIPQRISKISVAGATQFFRRQCFEEIGGYFPLSSGGIDSAAEIMARMKEWKTETIFRLKVLTHRAVITGHGSVNAARFNMGVMNYALGYHPLFQIASCLMRVTDHPILTGSVFVLAGYVWAMLKRYTRQVPEEFVKFLRDEQLRRMGLRRHALM